MEPLTRAKGVSLRCSLLTVRATYLQVVNAPDGQGNAKMSSEHNTVERTDAALRYYRQLRDAVLQAGREPGLRDHRFVAGVESVMTKLARLIFENQSLKDLDDVRK